MAAQSRANQTFSRQTKCEEQCLPLAPDRLPESGCNDVGQAVKCHYRPSGPARFCKAL